MSHEPDLALVDAVLSAVYQQDGNALVDIDAVWVMGVTLLADVLLRTNELERERLLRGLTRELREAMTGIQANMNGPVYPKADSHDTH